MGKSLGNVLEPGPLVRAYGSDAVRLFFTKEILFGQARCCLQVLLPSVLRGQACKPLPVPVLASGHST